MEFSFRNVNDAYVTMVPWLLKNGIETTSRNGPVVRAPGPVTWTFERPWERVMLDPERDANPFFHMFEGLWMILGSNHVDSLVHFVKKMVDFTDNGTTVPGAYGHRLSARVDQWRPALYALNKDPGTRRVVLAMYDARADSRALVNDGKDIPCNTHMYLTIREGRLNMTILNRSNDIEWGALGANAVHFSMILEWASDILGVSMGPMTTFSNDLHKYLDRNISPPPDEGWQPYDAFFSVVGLPKEIPDSTPTRCMPMRAGGKDWGKDLSKGVREGWRRNLDYKTEWFQTVFKPMMAAHNLYKDGHWARAWGTIQTVAAVDWRLAGEAWINARQPTES